jgi:small subunit ribosomal protein S17
MVSSDIKKVVVQAPVIHRQFHGVVVGDKNDKTIVVKVESVKKHPKYQKRYVVSQKYKVHDETNHYHVGDKVSFVECRPLSRDKRWRVVKAE